MIKQHDNHRHLLLILLLLYVLCPDSTTNLFQYEAIDLFYASMCNVERYVNTPPGSEMLCLR